MRLIPRVNPETYYLVRLDLILYFSVMHLHQAYLVKLYDLYLRKSEATLVSVPRRGNQQAQTWGPDALYVRLQQMNSLTFVPFSSDEGLVHGHTSPSVIPKQGTPISPMWCTQP